MGLDSSLLFFYIKLLHEYIKIYLKHHATQVLNVMTICFCLMLLMQFAVVSYSAIEQGLIILFMSKALEFNQKMIIIQYYRRKEKKGEINVYSSV